MCWINNRIACGCTASICSRSSHRYNQIDTRDLHFELNSTFWGTTVKHGKMWSTYIFNACMHICSCLKKCLLIIYGWIFFVLYAFNVFTFVSQLICHTAVLLWLSIKINKVHHSNQDVLIFSSTLKKLKFWSICDTLKIFAGSY